MADEIYLSTGEFAKLCKVKKQTLFHYDDIDLLKPAFTDEKGYRFYNPQQYESFVVIASLKEAGMSLSQIKEYMKQENSTDKLILMSKAYSKLSDRIDHLCLVRRILGEELNRARGALAVNDDLIHVESFAEQRFISSPRIDELDDESMVEAVTAFSSLAEVCCAAMSLEDIRKADFSHYSFLLARESTELREGKYHFPLYLRPAGEYVLAYHKGSYESIGESYQRVFDFMEEEGLIPMEYAYEEYLRNELTAAREEDYLTRISLHVRRKND